MTRKSPERQGERQGKPVRPKQARAENLASKFGLLYASRHTMGSKPRAGLGMEQRLDALEAKVAELHAKLEGLEGTQTKVGSEVTCGGGNGVNDVVSALRDRGEMTTSELCEVMQVPLEDIYPKLDEMRRAGNLAFVAGVIPRWRIPSGKPKITITDKVEKLLKIAPRTHSELMALTGAGRPGVSGALKVLQKRGARQIQVGERQRGNPWYIPES